MSQQIDESQVKNLVADLLPNSISDTNSIPFNKQLTVIADHTMSGSLVISPNTSGSVAGCGAIQRVIADGIHVPDVSAFKTLSSSYTYINTSGAVNIFIYFFDGANYNISITQNGVNVTDMTAQVAAWASRLSTAGYTISSGRQSAYLTFMNTIKSNGIYDLMTEIWLFEGGTAATNILGFKNAYNGTFNGTLTHASTGTTGDGSTGYMDLGFTPNLIGGGNMSVTVYLRKTSSNNGYALGSAGASGANYYYLSPRATTSYFGLGNLQTTISTTAPNGRFIVSRNAGNLSVTINGTSTDISGSSTVGGSTKNIFLFALNDFSAIDSFSNQEIGFCCIGAALTDSQASILDSAMNTLFTAISR